MSTRKRWSDLVESWPALTKEQKECVLEIIDYHLCGLVSDHPPVDDAWYSIQQDLGRMGAAAVKP